MTSNITEFAQRLAGAQPMVGTFVKTPSPIISEVLGMTSLDVCCLDAEHAPFGRADTDLCLAMLRAADMPSLVRVADDSSTEIRNALDSGATGILVPHVKSAAQAERIVEAAHFGEGGRGYAGSTRAAHYTRKAMPDHIADSAQQTTVVVQIEDIAALDQVDEIAQVTGVHALFIGRADLAVAMGLSPGDDKVMQTVADICQASVAAGCAVGMFTPNVDEIPHWRSLGASLFLLSSDHSFILQGAQQLAERCREGF